ncbi:MAG: aminotransferase class III-fold pyridoxal phosphate-dependent enzyme, partial [Myxococcota bacterium]
RKHESLGAQARGRGLIQGLDCPDAGFASEVSAAAFERGLVLETSGPESTVVKVMPPLVIEDDLLEDGLQILAQSLEAVIAARGRRLRVANPLEPEQTRPR